MKAKLVDLATLDIDKYLKSAHLLARFVLVYQLLLSLRYRSSIEHLHKIILRDFESEILTNNLKKNYCLKYLEKISRKLEYVFWKIPPTTYLGNKIKGIAVVTFLQTSYKNKSIQKKKNYCYY